MNRYYMPEIDLRIIRNNPHIIDNLKNKFKFTENKEKIIISTDGYYKNIDDEIIKYKIVNKENCITENFYNLYTLIGCNTYLKKQKNITCIPFEHDIIDLETVTFSLNKNNKSNIIEKKEYSNITNYLVLEFRNSRLYDLYFTSKKKVDEECKFFKKDVSLFMESLNI